MFQSLRGTKQSIPEADPDKRDDKRLAYTEIIQHV